MDGWFEQDVYHTVKTLMVKSLDKLGKLQDFTKFFANFDYFHNIPYADGLQFAKGFFAKLPTVHIHQTFLILKFFTVQ